LPFDVNCVLTFILNCIFFDATQSALLLHAGLNFLNSWSISAVQDVLFGSESRICTRNCAISSQNPMLIACFDCLPGPASIFTIRLISLSTPSEIKQKRKAVIVIGHGILAGKYLAEYRDSLK
jgi:hypothetical protein